MHKEKKPQRQQKQLQRNKSFEFNYSSFVLIILLFFIVTPSNAGSNYLNTPRIIRVGLEHVGHPSELKLRSSNKTFSVFDISKNKTLFLGKASTLLVKAKTEKGISIEINGKTFFANDSIKIANVLEKSRVSNKITITSENDKKRAYRGSFEIKNKNSQLYVTNIVDLEDYLKSVVPSEISTKAPQAAQEAQTIAARTYAIRNIDRHSKKDSYNLCDTIHCQAYFGISKECKAATKAVGATTGQILVYKNTPANSVYHSNCGGYLISSPAAWGGKSVPYLTGHFDGIKGDKPFCDYGNDYLTKKNKIQFPAKSPKLTIGKTSESSKKKLHNNFGHRVGLCQDGAIGMAAIGYSCKNILDFYYPKTKIVTLKYALPSEVNKTLAPTNVIASNKSSNKVPPKGKNSAKQPSNAASQNQLLAKANTYNNLSYSDTDNIQLFKRCSSASLISVIKEVSDVKPNSTYTGIKKFIWRPLDTSATKKCCQKA